MKIHAIVVMLSFPFALMAQEVETEMDTCHERYLEVVNGILEKVPFNQCNELNMDDPDSMAIIEDQGGITENNIAFVMTMFGAAAMGELSYDLEDADDLRVAMYSCKKAAIVIMNHYSDKSCVFSAMLTTNNPAHRSSGWTPENSGFKVWEMDIGIIEDTTIELFIFTDEGDINASNIKEYFKN